MKFGRTAFMIVAVAMIFGLITAIGSVHAQRAGSALFGRAFHSSHAVIKNGERHALVEGTRIRLKFSHDDERDVIRWRSGCNLFGARVEVTTTHLDVGQVSGTDIGCPKPLARQDRWVSNFMDSDPSWTRQGRKLRLTRGDDVIRLRRRVR